MRLDPAVEDVGVLLEPTSVVAKAWEHIEAIGRRARWEPETVTVTGAGPIGLLAALLGVQRGLDVHVFDIVEEGIKPELVHLLGATYHSEPTTESGLAPDVVVECSGVPSVVVDVLSQTGRDGLVCLTGVSPVGRQVELQNDAIFGSVNANRRHYVQAAEDLARADHDWLARLITRRVPLGSFRDALRDGEVDVKVLIELAH